MQVELKMIGGKGQIVRVRPGPHGMLQDVETGFLASRWNYTSRSDLNQIVQFLELVQASKAVIMSEAQRFQTEYFKDPDAFDTFEKLHINVGKYTFNLFAGLCHNMTYQLELNVTPDLLGKVAAQYFFDGNSIHSSVTYPVDGFDLYMRDHHGKSFWLNERRWTYVDFMIKKLKEFSVQLGE